MDPVEYFKSGEALAAAVRGATEEARDIYCTRAGKKKSQEGLNPRSWL